MSRKDSSDFYRLVAALITIAGIGGLVLAGYLLGGGPLDKALAPMIALASLCAIGTGVIIDRVIGISERLEEIETERPDAGTTGGTVGTGAAGEAVSH